VSISVLHEIERSPEVGTANCTTTQCSTPRSVRCRAHVFPEALRDPGTVPADWYTRIFDSRYLAVDSIRNSRRVTMAEVHWLLDVIAPAPGAKVLDLCCGYGRHAVQLAERGFQVHGLDASPGLLEVAADRALMADVNVVWHCRDMREVPREDYDLVICMHTSFGYLPDPEDDIAVLEAVHRSLAPGGHLVLHYLDPQRAATSSLRETFILADGTTFRRESMVSRGDQGYTTWHGYYLYGDGGDVGDTCPFRIRLYDDSVMDDLLRRLGFESVDGGIPEWEERAGMSPPRRVRVATKGNGEA